MVLSAVSLPLWVLSVTETGCTREWSVSMSAALQAPCVMVSVLVSSESVFDVKVTVALRVSKTSFISACRYTVPSEPIREVSQGALDVMVYSTLAGMSKQSVRAR